MTHEIVTTAFRPIQVQAPEISTHETAEQLLYIVFKRWRLLLGLVVALVGAASYVVLSKDPVYTAVAKILLKPDRVSLKISELSTDSSRTPYSLQALQSEIEIIRSQDVLRPVARALLAEAQGGAAPSDEAVAAKLASLRNSLSATAMKDASILQIRLRSSRPDVAEGILDRIVASYLEHHALAYSGSAQLLEFYEQEKQRVFGELTAAENALGRWQEANRVIAPDQQIAGLLSQRSDLERQLKEARSGTELRIQADPLVARTEGELMSAQVALGDLRQRYTDSNRLVQEKLEQQTLLRRQRISVEKALLASIGAQQASLAGQIGNTDAALAELRRKKLEGDRLARTLEQARGSFALYSKNLEEARISSKLDRAQLSNLAIIEQPNATGATDADERAGLVVLAGIVALTLGLVAAFALEFFNKSLRTRRDVEVYLGIPVLAAIPDLRVRMLADARAGAPTAA